MLLHDPPVTDIIDLIHKIHNAPVPYPTIYHSEQKCSYFCSEWRIVGYGTGALWHLWDWSIYVKFGTLRLVLFQCWILSKAYTCMWESWHMYGTKTFLSHHVTLISIVLSQFFMPICHARWRKIIVGMSNLHRMCVEIYDIKNPHSPDRTDMN